MNRLRCRWNDSREVDPRTHLKTGAGCPLEDSACLGVQLHLMLSLGVLDADNMGLEGFPHRPHLGVEQRHTKRVAPLLPLKGKKELVDEFSGRLDTACLSPAVESQLFLADVAQGVTVRRGPDAHHLHLWSLGCNQSIQILPAVLKYALRQPVEEELVSISGAVNSEPAHEVPDVQAEHGVWPRPEHLTQATVWGSSSRTGAGSSKAWVQSTNCDITLDH